MNVTDIETTNNNNEQHTSITHSSNSDGDNTSVSLLEVRELIDRARNEQRLKFTQQTQSTEKQNSNVKDQIVKTSLFLTELVLNLNSLINDCHRETDQIYQSSSRPHVIPSLQNNSISADRLIRFHSPSKHELLPVITGQTPFSQPSPSLSILSNQNLYLNNSDDERCNKYNKNDSSHSLTQLNPAPTEFEFAQILSNQKFQNQLLAWRDITSTYLRENELSELVHRIRISQSVFAIWMCSFTQRYRMRVMRRVMVHWFKVTVKNKIDQHRNAIAVEHHSARLFHSWRVLSKQPLSQRVVRTITLQNSLRMWIFYSKQRLHHRRIKLKFATVAHKCIQRRQQSVVKQWYNRFGHYKYCLAQNQKGEQFRYTKRCYYLTKEAFRVWFIACKERKCRRIIEQHRINSLQKTAHIFWQVYASRRSKLRSLIEKRNGAMVQHAFKVWVEFTELQQSYNAIFYRLQSNFIHWMNTTIFDQTLQ